MARLKHKLSEPPVPPERGVKAATFKLLLDTAMDIIRQSGHIPSVAEAAARSKEFEAQLRAAAQLSLEQWGLERAGLLEEEPYRRGHRVRILEHAIEPLAPLMRPAVRDRLHHALSVVYGIEPYVILKDIWGLRDREVEKTALWMADALIDAALRDAEAKPLKTKST